MPLRFLRCVTASYDSTPLSFSQQYVSVAFMSFSVTGVQASPISHIDTRRLYTWEGVVKSELVSFLFYGTARAT